MKQPAPHYQRLTLVVLTTIVVMMVTWAHWPALSVKAISFDDQQYMTDNVLVQNPSWSSTMRFLTEVLTPSTVGGYYQPLTMISLMLDCAMGGGPDNLRPFHRTSLALHAANTALIIMLLYLLFGEPWIAALVGLLFGVHPLTVEPIPWIGERKTLLASFFAIIALITYIQYARNASQPARRGDTQGQGVTIRGAKPWYIFCVIFYALALLAKPTTTALPICMLLLDYWPLRRLNKRTVKEKIPFFAIGLISSVITFISQQRTALVYNPGQRSLLRIPLILCHNIVFYLYKMIWPHHLSSHYPFPEPMTLLQPMIMVGVIGTCALIILLLISLRWTKALTIGWLFFFAAIFPTMGVIGFTNVIASDKYVYLPALGILMALAYLLTQLWRTYSSFGRRIAIVAPMIVLSSLETVATRSYLTVWQSSETLYQYMLDLAPNSAMLYNNMGNALIANGRYKEATPWFQKALDLRPNFEDAHVDLGFALESQGKTDEAIKHYREALRLKPDHAVAHNDLGISLSAQGKKEEAIEHFQSALQLNPEFAKAHANLGLELADQGRMQEAIEHYHRALELNPNFVEIHNRLGLALSAQAKNDEAVTQFHQALEMKPDDVDAYNNLGNVFSHQGQIEEAITCYRRVLELNPNYRNAHTHLGIALVQKGQRDEAVAHFRQALKMDSNDMEAHYNLAVALVDQGQISDAVPHYQQVLQSKPSNADAHNNLGVALARLGKTEEAVVHFRQAVQLDPGRADAHNNLGNALTQGSNVNEAMEQYRQALRLKPDYVDAHNNLGIMLHRQGRIDEAVAEYREALRIDPGNKKAQHLLHMILSSQPAK